MGTLYRVVRDMRPTPASKGAARPDGNACKDVRLAFRGWSLLALILCRFARKIYVELRRYTVCGNGWAGAENKVEAKPSFWKYPK